MVTGKEVLWLPGLSFNAPCDKKRDEARFRLESIIMTFSGTSAGTGISWTEGQWSLILFQSRVGTTDPAPLPLVPHEQRVSTVVVTQKSRSAHLFGILGQAVRSK